MIVGIICSCLWGARATTPFPRPAKQYPETGGRGLFWSRKSICSCLFWTLLECDLKRVFMLSVLLNRAAIEEVEGDVSELESKLDKVSPKCQGPDKQYRTGLWAGDTVSGSVQVLSLL